MYLQLISIHGLVRADAIEMGRDADTGGQVRYVLELARHLASLDEVQRVDLITRKLVGSGLDGEPLHEAYSRDMEVISEKCHLVRIPFADCRYMRKEELWPWLDEAVERLLEYTRSSTLQPTIVHGHYADAGYIARHVARQCDCPFVFTAHSLGRPKLAYLLSEGWSREQADRVLNMERRIAEEEECVQAAGAIIVSTNHESDTQYAEYAVPHKAPIHVIPPGTDLTKFFPYYDYDLPSANIDERYKQARNRIQRRLKRFLAEPNKPLVLAVCRPDRRKNIQALLKAYGESPELQAIANLAVFAGVREDIESMPENERQVLTEILLLMDRYDLYGRIAIPKRHDSDYDVPELYRLTAGLRGIFVNSAFIELFGLTAIEAAAVGLPFVATADGGPQDIVANCRSGITVDVTNQDELIAAMLKLLTDQELWEASSLSGINNVRTHYSWATHCRDYISLVRRLIGADAAIVVDTTSDEQRNDDDSAGNRSDTPSSSKSEFEAQTHPDIAAAARNTVCRSSLVTAMSRRLQRAEVMLISDIDGTLTGDAAALESLMECVRRSNGRICFGVASGRSPALVEAAIADFRLELPEIIIASVGSEILLGPYREIWTDWSDTIADDWRPHALAERLAELDCIEPQAGPHQQGPFKLSYILRSGMTIAEARGRIEEQLRGADSPYRLIISHGNLVDVLPAHSGKGNALRFLLERLDFPLDLVLAAGDSENDRDILTMGLKSIVVGNHASGLGDLRIATSSNIYFSNAHHAAGVMEGLQHYGFVFD